jgi:hypothetical protein
MVLALCPSVLFACISIVHVVLGLVFIIALRVFGDKGQCWAGQITGRLM